jgi:hypothetical protein
MENVPAGRSEERSDEHAAVARRQNLGLFALVLMLVTIVVLAVLGQPWVAGAVAAGLTAVVAIFVTGQHREDPQGLPSSGQPELEGVEPQDPPK